MKINAGNLKKGDFIYHQNATWQVQRADFYSPGKGSALMKAKIKNLLTGKNIDYTLKSNESVETLTVEVVEMQYLYKDNENIYLMDERTYNQYNLSRKIVGEIADFLKEGNKYYVYIQEDKPLNIRPPMSVRLRVEKTEDSVRGDTVTGAKKPAKLETGVTVMVPLFIKVGDIITVNPETKEYVERVKA